MTSLSKKIQKTNSRLVDLSVHSDEELHSLMDSVTAEMARRASVNARRREVMRRLENLAEAEGMTLDEVRGFLKGNRIAPKREAAADTGSALVPDDLSEEQLEIPALEKCEPVRELKPDLESSFKGQKKPSLESQFESMMKRELAELA